MNLEPLPRWRVVPALALGTLMATIDISAVNIALPTLSRTFGLPLTTIEWVVLAYVLTITALLLPLGRLADRVGRRRIYATGLVLFIVASAGCAAAPSAALLIAARAVQGLGAAMMTANSAALLISSFRGDERGRALGVFGAVVGVGLAIGPPLGGLIIAKLSWRWIFLVNIPVGLLAQWMVRTRVPADRIEPGPLRIDAPGAVLSTAALTLLLLGLSRGPTQGFDSREVIGTLALAALLVIAFLWVELRSPDPLLPLALMRGPVGNAGLLTFIAQALSISIGIHMPLYLEEVLGFDAARSGQWLAIVPVAALFTAPLAGRWSDHWGPKHVGTVGMSIAVPGYAMLATLGHEPRMPLLIIGLALIGVGLGLFTVPNASGLLGAAGEGNLGLAAGLQATMRNLGISSGTAATAAIVASRYSVYSGQHLSGHHAVVRTAFALATRDLYASLAGLAAIAVALVAFGPHVTRPAPASV